MDGGEIVGVLQSPKLVTFLSPRPLLHVVVNSPAQYPYTPLSNHMALEMNYCFFTFEK